MPTIVKIIRSLNDMLVDWILRKKLNPDNNPARTFEVELWLQIHGQTNDGNSNYKKVHYDKIFSEAEKIKVRKTLLDMLKSTRYTIAQKAIIAYVCADIKIVEALQDIQSLRQQAMSQSFERHILTLASEALSKGVSVRELVGESDSSVGKA